MKNSQKGFIPLVLLIIVAVVAIGGGTYFYTQQKSVAKDKTSDGAAQGISTTTASIEGVNSKTNVNVQATTSVKVTLPSKTLPNQIIKAGWKTYTDDKYGFKVDYPNNTSIKVSDSGVRYINFRESDSVFPLLTISIQDTQKDVQQTPQEYIDEQISFLKKEHANDMSLSLKYASTKVDGVTATHETTCRPISSKECAITIYIAHDNRLYTIDGGIPVDLSEQMLASFRFKK